MFRHPAHLGRLPAGLRDPRMLRLMPEMMPLLLPPGLTALFQSGIFAESITRFCNVLIQLWSMQKTYATSPHVLQPALRDVLPCRSVFNPV